MTLQSHTCIALMLTSAHTQIVLLPADASTLKATNAYSPVVPAKTYFGLLCTCAAIFNALGYVYQYVGLSEFSLML